MSREFRESQQRAFNSVEIRGRVSAVEVSYQHWRSVANGALIHPVAHHNKRLVFEPIPFSELVDETRRRKLQWALCQRRATGA